MPAWHRDCQSGAAAKVPQIVFATATRMIDDIADSDEVDMYPAMDGIAVRIIAAIGRAGGAPSEKAIVADGVRFVDTLLKRGGDRRHAWCFHGRSLGGGVACGWRNTDRHGRWCCSRRSTRCGRWRRGSAPRGFLVRHRSGDDEVRAQFDRPFCSCRTADEQ